MHYLVTFSGAEETGKVLSLAVHLAAANQARITILKVIADPHSVGIVAELIATEEPFVIATEELHQAVEKFVTDDIAITSVVWKAPEVGKGIVTATAELGADVVFVGTRDVSKQSGWFMENDPIAHYIVNHCPANIMLVRD